MLQQAVVVLAVVVVLSCHNFCVATIFNTDLDIVAGWNHCSTFSGTDDYVFTRCRFAGCVAFDGNGSVTIQDSFIVPLETPDVAFDFAGIHDGGTVTLRNNTMTRPQFIFGLGGTNTLRSVTIDIQGNRISTGSSMLFDVLYKLSAGSTVWIHDNTIESKNSSCACSPLLSVEGAVSNGSAVKFEDNRVTVSSCSSGSSVSDLLVLSAGISNRSEFSVRTNIFIATSVPPRSSVVKASSCPFTGASRASIYGNTIVGAISTNDSFACIDMNCDIVDSCLDVSNNTAMSGVLGALEFAVLNGSWTRATVRVDGNSVTSTASATCIRRTVLRANVNVAQTDFTFSRNAFVLAGSSGDGTMAQLAGTAWNDSTMALAANSLLASVPMNVVQFAKLSFGVSNTSISVERNTLDVTNARYCYSMYTGPATFTNATIHIRDNNMRFLCYEQRYLAFESVRMSRCVVDVQNNTALTNDTQPLFTSDTDFLDLISCTISDSTTDVSGNQLSFVVDHNVRALDTTSSSFTRVNLLYRRNIVRIESPLDELFTFMDHATFLQSVLVLEGNVVNAKTQIGMAGFFETLFCSFTSSQLTFTSNQINQSDSTTTMWHSSAIAYYETSITNCTVTYSANIIRVSSPDEPSAFWYGNNTHVVSTWIRYWRNQLDVAWPIRSRNCAFDNQNSPSNRIDIVGNTFQVGTFSTGSALKCDSGAPADYNKTALCWAYNTIKSSTTHSILSKHLPTALVSCTPVHTTDDCVSGSASLSGRTVTETITGATRTLFMTRTTTLTQRLSPSRSLRATPPPTTTTAVPPTTTAATTAHPTTTAAPPTTTPATTTPPTTTAATTTPPTTTAATTAHPTTTAAPPTTTPATTTPPTTTAATTAHPTTTAAPPTTTPATTTPPTTTAATTAHPTTTAAPPTTTPATTTPPTTTAATTTPPTTTAATTTPPTTTAATTTPPTTTAATTTPPTTTATTTTPPTTTAATTTPPTTTAATTTPPTTTAATTTPPTTTAATTTPPTTTATTTAPPTTAATTTPPTTTAATTTPPTTTAATTTPPTTTAATTTPPTTTAATTTPPTTTAATTAPPTTTAATTTPPTTTAATTAHPITTAAPPTATPATTTPPTTTVTPPTTTVAPPATTTATTTDAPPTPPLSTSSKGPTTASVPSTAVFTTAASSPPPSRPAPATATPTSASALSPPEIGKILYIVGSGLGVCLLLLLALMLLIRRRHSNTLRRRRERANLSTLMAPPRNNMQFGLASAEEELLGLRAEPDPVSMDNTLLLPVPQAGYVAPLNPLHRVSDEDDLAQ